ncbi:MAG: hypothetical protein ACK5QS_08830 [Pseudanabaenaceae cyanobacterium]
MDRQEFDNKRKSLTTIQKIDFEYFLKSRSDDEIAEIRGVDRSSVTRNINNIAKVFGIKPEKDIKGKAIEKNVQKFKLLELCLTHIPEEVTQPHIYDQLVSRSEITNLVTRPQPLINPQNIPIPESIPELTTLEFIGRDRDLTHLANRRKQYKIVLIKAGAGVGKSTLAREFLQTQFKKVIRIEMGLESGNVTPAEEKVSQILRKDFDEEPSRDFGINLDILREKLSDRTNPIGVLIDNLEPALDENYRFRDKLRGYDALLAVLGDRDVFSFTLITSRRSLITPRAKVNEYSLEGLDITAWRQYFHDCENGADSEAILQMRNAYNGNAKVMDILHGAIKNRFDGNIGAYWNRYKDALLADSELETLISVEMDWLRDNQPDAYKLLCRMGCYRYQDVKTVPFEGLICLLWDVPESQQIGIVDYLSKTSLIEVKGEYYLHPAVRDAAKLHLLENKTDWEKTHRSCAEFWSKSILIIRSINDVIQAMEAYHHYIEISDLTSAGEVLIAQKTREKEYINKPVCLGTLLFQYGLLGASVFKAEDIINNISSKTYLYARLHNILGNHYAISGNPRKGIVFHHKCLDVSNEINIASMVYSSLINIGHHSLYLLETEEAIKYLKKISLLLTDDNICESKSIHEYEHIHTRHNYGAYAYMAYANSLQGDLAEASRFANLFLDMPITNEFDDYDNYNEAYEFAFLGKAYINLNIFDKAVYALSKAYSIADKYSFPEVIGIVYISISQINYKQKNLDSSIVFCQFGIEILEKISAICELAEAYFQIALIYKKIGENEQTEKYKKIALELFNQMNAPKQIKRLENAFK